MYYLADLFTLAEVILSIVLFKMAITGAPVDHALWVFVAGEICDALDGPCARRWHYPNDGKTRIWREFNSEIDQASDILLAAAIEVFILWRVSLIFGGLLSLIGIFCLIVQCHLYYYDHNRREFRCRYYIYTDNLIVLRRRIYVIGGVGGAIAILVWHTEWTFAVKVITTIVGVIIGLIIKHYKTDRWNDNKTPL